MLKKKIVASLIVLGSLLTFFVGTTLAYFVSASKPLINTFTVGKIQLELTETTGANYALVPGTTVEKDPKITVKAGSEACWLFVQLKKANGVDDYVSYQVSDGWTLLGGNDGVYYRSVAKTQEDVAYTVLKDNQITIKDTVTEEQASLITSKPKLTVYAYAVQSDSVATAAEAWTIMQANLQE